LSTQRDDHRAGRRFGIALGLIAVAGLVGRIIYTVLNQDLPIKSDGVHYSFAAGLLADGQGFINPLRLAIDGTAIQDATHPPGWTSILTLVTLAGFRSNFAYQVTAAFVGTGTIVMVGLAGREAFGRRIGLIAAALACLYPGIWLYERELVSEPLGLLGVSTLIWLAYRFRNRPGPWRAIALGAVLGLCALTRSEFIIISLLVVTPIILGARAFSIGRRAAWLAMAAVATMMVISPWYLYNTTRFSQPVPLSVGMGGTMVAGNCPPAYEGELIGYFNFGCVVYVSGIDSDPSIADGQYRAIAFEFIKNHKAEFAKVATIRVLRTFSIYDPLDQRELEAERGSPMWVLTTALFSFYVLVPFAIAGGVVARRRKVPLYPLLAFVLIALLIVVPTIGAVRYRSSAEIALVILAAAGIDAAIRWFASRRQPASATADARSTNDPVSPPASVADPGGDTVDVSVASRTTAPIDGIGEARAGFLDVLQRPFAGGWRRSVWPGDRSRWSVHPVAAAGISTPAAV
jgi:hypothetical protein